MPRTITTEKAQQHEALYLRLGALDRHVAALAVRAPQGPVSEAVRILAEGLMCDARRFTGERGLPAAFPTYGGLAAGLGQVLAALDAFELRHTQWDAKLKCLVWCRQGSDPLPVQRLHPQPAAMPAPARHRDVSYMQRKILQRLDQRYDEGYDDALAGRERQPSRYGLVKADASSSQRG